MIKLADEKEYKAACKQHAVGLNQTWDWGETRGNFEPKRLLHNGFPITIFIRTELRGAIRFGYLPRCFNADYINKDNLQELIDFSEGLNISHIILEPEVEHTPERLDIFIKSGFKNSGKTIQPQQTQIIGLDESEEDLFSHVKSKRRRDIRKNKKDGLEVAIDNSTSGFEKFQLVMNDIIQNRNFTMHNPQYFEKVYQIYKDNPQFNIYIAQKSGELHGAFLTVSNDHTTYELYGGVNKLGAKSRSNFLLKWSTVVGAKENGDEFYDNWGIAKILPNGEFDKKDPLYNISKFKEAFGGRAVVFLPQLTYVYKPVSYRIFSLGLSLHKQMINFKNR